MPNGTTVHAAITKKAKKTLVKNIQTKRPAKTYHINWNLKNPLKSKVKTINYGPILKGNRKLHAYYTITYKGKKYYYLGATTVIKASDVNKLQVVPSLKTLLNNNKNAKEKAKKKALELENKQTQWNKKLQDAKVKTIPAKTNMKTPYWELNNDKSIQKEMDMGTPIQVLFVEQNGLTQNGKNINAYVAVDKNNTYIVIPANAVTLDNNQDQVLTQDEYKSKVANYNNLYNEAKKDLNIGNK